MLCGEAPRVLMKQLVLVDGAPCAGGGAQLVVGRRRGGARPVEELATIDGSDVAPHVNTMGPTGDGPAARADVRDGVLVTGLVSSRTNGERYRSLKLFSWDKGAKPFSPCEERQAPTSIAHVHPFLQARRLPSSRVLLRA